MEVSRDGQICAIFGKGDLFGANPKSEKAERSSANVRALRKMLKLTLGVKHAGKILKDSLRIARVSGWRAV